MGTFKDEDIFNTISRDMKDTSPGGDKIGDDDFAVPTMPTFKYTLSEDEIWAIVGYVRGLHGMKLEFKVEERKKELAEALQDGHKRSSIRQRRPMRRPKRKPARRRKRKEASDVDRRGSRQRAGSHGAGAKKELDDSAGCASTILQRRPGKG